MNSYPSKDEEIKNIYKYKEINFCCCNKNTKEKENPQQEMRKKFSQLDDMLHFLLLLDE